jgi:hypothetical protein
MIGCRASLVATLGAGLDRPDGTHRGWLPPESDAGYPAGVVPRRTGYGDFR